MRGNDRPLVILIDTNAMITLYLYWESCKATGLEIGSDQNNIKDKLGKEYIETGHYDPIKKGYDLFKYIKERNQEGIVMLYFSVLSEVELLHVSVERKFDQLLTQKGIPYRIRIRKPFRTQVHFDYEKEIALKWSSFLEEMKKINVEFHFPERDGGGNGALIEEVVDICKILSKYIVLDPVDLYLHSLAIYLMADEIITHDNEFRDIINKLRTDKDWKTIKDKITADLVNLLRGYFKEEFDKEGIIRFPEGKFPKGQR